MIDGNYLSWPEAGDRGSVFGPKIVTNFETLDEHVHDGVTSDKISAKHVNKGAVTLATSDWVLAASGDYRQTLTLPSGYAFDTCGLRFFINSGAHSGKEIHPTVIKLTTTTVEVSVMTNSFDVKAVIS